MSLTSRTETSPTKTSPTKAPEQTLSQRRHQVVIIGSGFGGLFAAKALKRDDVDITLISATSSHLFQPLLYQVATGILSTGEIAPATREILKRQRNARVILGTVTRIDLAERTVHAEALGETFDTAYDTLIVAAGAGQSYFGRDEFATYAPGMKTIDDALEARVGVTGVTVGIVRGERSGILHRLVIRCGTP